MNKRFQIFLASLLIVVFLVSSKSGKLVHAAVFGGDERQKVQDTNIFPWNGVVQIQYTVLDQNNQLAKGLCSGTFINAHTILTAAHCLYSKDFNHWDSTVTLRPGANGGNNPTYGEYTISPAAPQLRVPPEYIENVNDVSAAMYDYGVILLPDDTFGSQGETFFRPTVLPDASLVDQNVTIAGYPAPGWSSLFGFPSFSLVQKQSSGVILGADIRMLSHRIDTSEGNSGGPIYIVNRADSAFQVGVVSNEGTDGNTGELINYATRITSEVYSRITFWSTWQAPVVRLHALTGFDRPIAASLVVTAGDAWEPLAVYSIVINADGWSDPILLSGLPLGGFQKGGFSFYLKPQGMLGRKVRAYLPASSGVTTLDFTPGPTDYFVKADINEDNVVNQLDYAVWSNEFHCFMGSSGCTTRSDVNWDGSVDVIDYSLWHMSYWNANGRPGEGWPESGTHASSAGLDAGSMSREQIRGSAYTYVYVKPVENQYAVGDVVEIQLLLSTGAKSLAGVELNIEYDPGVLEMIDDDPSQEGIQAVVAPLFQEVDANQSIVPGSYLLSTRNTDDAMFSGSSALLATIHFRALASISQTSVAALFESGWTTDSNSITQGLETDQLDLVLNDTLSITGVPARPEPLVTVFTNEDPSDPLTLSVGALADDPYDRVQSVEFTYFVDGIPYSSSIDHDGSDGWSDVTSKSIFGGPRNIEIQASARLPADLVFNSTLLPYIVDWTPPIYLSSTRYEGSDYIWISVTATDDFSGVAGIRAMYNTDPDGTDSGQWVTIGDDAGDPGWIFWDLTTNPPSPGRHRVAFEVRDAAGNLSSNLAVDFPVYYFNMGVPAPGAFSKTLPANDSLTGTSLVLTWDASGDAAGYEVCLFLAGDPPCLDSGWIDAGVDTSLTLSGLTNGATYSWQVRAVNPGGITYADGWEQAYSSFRTNHTGRFMSAASTDGWILESGENTNLGGTMASASTTLRLGDDGARKQYRSLLSFATASLPDNAVITKVTLKVKRQGVIGGGNPVTTFQGFMLDIRKGTFGTSVLQTTDFQTTAHKTVGPFSPALVGGWYEFNLTSAKAYINKLATLSGLTQIRLRFKLDDNNNTIANYLSLYSGSAGTASRPTLIIEYYVP